MLTSELGFQLWNGNNPATFSKYPAQSIDRSEEASRSLLTPEERAELAKLGEVASNQWFYQKAKDNMLASPQTTLARDLQKIAAAFSWHFNPERGGAEFWAHLLSYGPVSVLGAIGMWRNRRQWRSHGLVYLLFLTFAAVTALFFGHSNHRSYLDVYLIVFASSIAGKRYLPRPETAYEGTANQSCRSEY
jgi:hypothetical protein